MESLIGAASWLWTAVLTAFYFLVVITMIATIHEFGHYIICKLLGVRVDEFSIGFGKLLFGRKWGETEYSLRAWPIAAYVRPAGMDPAEEEQEGYVSPGERSFNKKNSGVKYAILLGGSLFNLLSTVVFLTFLFMLGEGSTVLVNSVSKYGPADVAGIKPKDLFLRMDGQPIKDADEAIRSIKSRPGQKIPIVVRRGSQEIQLVIEPKSDGKDGKIGISYEAEDTDTPTRGLAFWPALLKARGKTWEYVLLSYSGALGIFSKAFSKKEIPEDVGGPIAIVGSVGSHVKKGMTARRFLTIMAMLSLAIGVFNLLPIPALDGGRILVLFVRDTIDLVYTLVFWKHPDESIFSHRLEEIVHLVGILSLLILLVLVSFNDIRNLFTPREEVKLPIYASPGASPSPAASPLPNPSPSPSPSPAR